MRMPALRILGTLAALALVGFAGCVDADAPPASTQETPWPDGTLAAGSAHNLTLQDMDYQDSVRRFQVTALENLTFNATTEILLGTSYQDDDCAAVVITGPAGSAQGGIVVWAWRNRIGADATVAGFAVPAVSAFPSGSSYGGVEGTMNLELGLETGQSVLIEMGGHTPSFAAAALNGQRDAIAKVSFMADGALVLTEVEPRAIRCGVGPSQSQEAVAHASAPVLEVGLDAPLRMTTGNASTLAFLSRSISPRSSVAVEFQGETTDAGDNFAESSPDGGELGVVFAEWEEASPNGAWFMGDVEWPFLVDAIRGA